MTTIVNIGDGTPFANPYLVGIDGFGDEVLQKYRNHITTQLVEADPIMLASLLAINEGDELNYGSKPSLNPNHAPVIEDLLRSVKGYIPRPRKRHYAGIGARPKSPSKPNGLPPEMFTKLTRIAERLDHHGFTLRSGRADGCDVAFEIGASRKEIFLPWKGFSKDLSEKYALSVEFDRHTIERQAYKLANIVYPTDLNKAKQSLRKLMARNCYQILGYDLKSPVEMVICWTEDGCESRLTRTRDTGGTGQAIALADLFGIPVYNLKNPDALDRLSFHVKRITG